MLSMGYRAGPRSVDDAAELAASPSPGMPPRGPLPCFRPPSASFRACRSLGPLETLMLPPLGLCLRALGHYAVPFLPVARLAADLRQLLRHLAMIFQPHGYSPWPHDCTLGTANLRSQPLLAALANRSPGCHCSSSGSAGLECQIGVKSLVGQTSPSPDEGRGGRNQRGQTPLNMRVLGSFRYDESWHRHRA